jgi:hypothetical protein
MQCALSALHEAGQRAVGSCDGLAGTALASVHVERHCAARCADLPREIHSDLVSRSRHADASNVSAPRRLDEIQNRNVADK